MECHNSELHDILTLKYASTERELRGIQSGEYGIITNIQRFCVHDGPGIRTLVFFKGCPMRCIWCQNPESNYVQRELMHRAEKCILCGYCIKSCKKGAIKFTSEGIIIDRTSCDLCGKCVETCYAGSMELLGKLYSVEQVVDEVIRDEAFYKQSKGGVTLSGGEVTLQHRFAHRILSELHSRGIGTAIETAGFCRWEALKTLLPDTDLFLFDIKHMDEQVHKKYTGVSNRCIQENLRRLSAAGAKIIIRMPLIPGINDYVEHIESVAALAKSVNAVEFHILPFHQAGKSKWAALDKEYLCGEWGTHTSEYLNEILTVAEAQGIPVNIGGGGSGLEDEPNHNLL